VGSGLVAVITSSKGSDLAVSKLYHRAKRSFQVSYLGKPWEIRHISFSVLAISAARHFLCSPKRLVSFHHVS